MPKVTSTEEKVIFGGWYQRTTLHLSEVYDLFNQGKTNLPLSLEKLSDYKNQLGLVSISRLPGYLEFVEAHTRLGITIRYYEDGLYTLEYESSDILGAQRILKDYFESKFLPAINYIFSLGAPTPKILANIKTEHPTVITKHINNFDNFEVEEEKFGKVYSKIMSGNFAVYKTPLYIFILSNHENSDALLNLVDMQIFFREFKDQLEKYLNIHRLIWEEISALKERSQVKGKEIKEERAKLDQYQKTISLISNRINQMGAYIATRQSISKELKIEESLLKLFQYKFEALSDTLSYIKEIWKMTLDYLASAIQVLQDLEERSLNSSVKSLQIITSIGVVAGVLGYISRDSLPKPTFFGLEFLIVLLIITVASNVLISFFYDNIKYRVKFSERKKDI